MTKELERRIKALESRLDAIEPSVSRMIPLGPNPKREQEFERQCEAAFQKIVDEIKVREAPPVNRSSQQLVSGTPVPSDGSHTKHKDNGQQQDYVVLTAEERSKGFVRPVRRSYRHMGAPLPKHTLRDLRPDEDHHQKFGYVKFEAYPESDSPATGRFWTQDQLDAVDKGCGTLTTMGMAIAETYARDPKFYGGTFCCGCGKHLPVNEFVWDGTNERVGS